MITVLCLTKARPHNITRLIKSAKETVSRIDNFEFLFVVDKGDKTSVPTTEYRIVEQENRIFSDMPNAAIPFIKSDYVFLVGDDCVFQTKNWDLAFEKTFKQYPDGICLLHPNDLVYPDGRIPTHIGVTKTWINVLGYLSPPHFHVEYSDVWVGEIARRVNRCVFLKDVVVEHMHWYHGKAPMDETYSARRPFVGQSAKFWAESQHLRDQDVAKLQTHINSHKKT